jgi:outer membrane protein assembly factor BamB
VQKLGVSLAKIGEGLAGQTLGHPDAAAVQRLQTIVNILEDEIPQIDQPAKMLEEIKGVLKQSRRKVEGGRELDQTVDAIRKDAEANDVQAAYAAYRDLVRMYPELADDARLTDAMQQVSAVQQKAVKLVEKPLAAVHEERPSDLLAAMPLAVQPLKGDLADARGKLVFVVEQGTAYGLDAATGKTLWRRFVAQDTKLPVVTALPIAGPAGGDVVLCDPVHQELLRVQGATGKLLWRLVVGEPIGAEPVRADKWLLLLAKGQRLLVVDLATGDAPRYFALPQPVRLPPVVDAVHGLVCLTAEKSNLFVLETGQLDRGQAGRAQAEKGNPDACPCKQVFHLGHAAGTIAAPPAIVDDFLLAAVNDAPGQAAIRVLAISKDKEGGALRSVQSIRVAGYIDTTPAACPRGAAVITAEGSLFALGRNEDGNQRAFEVVASIPVSLKEKTTHYVVSAGGLFWVADRQLTRYAVPAARRQAAGRLADERPAVAALMPQATCDLGMKFVRAPLIARGTMYQVLQRAGMPGATVAAFDLAKNEARWQTWLAAPLAAEPVPVPISGKLTVVTASGGMFRAAPDDLKPAARPWDPILAVETSSLTRPLCSLLPLPGGRYAMTSGADTRQIVIYDPKEQDKQFRWLLCPREMSVPPVAFAGGLLTACVNGQVFLLDAEALGNMAKPLEPVVQGVNTWEWQAPVAVDDQQAVLCDGDRRLMAVRIGTDDEKALVESAETLAKSSLVSPIAVLGKVLFVVARGAADASDSLLSFELPQFTPGTSLVLGSHRAWGPQRVGKLVLVATEKNRLLAIDQQQKVVWQSFLSYGPLAGVPYLSGDEIFLSARGGMLWRISAADGKELGKADAGCPLGTGPVVLGGRVIVGGHEGSLLEVKKP